MTTQKTLRGPRGLLVELDQTQVIRDDPGQGTPAIVCIRNRKGC